MNALVDSRHGLVVAAAVLSFVLSGVLAYVLRRWGVFDPPTARSNHARPVPRGGGLAILAVVFSFMPLLHVPAAFLAPLALLAAVSAWDDYRPLPWQVRLLVHCLAIGLLLAVAQAQGWLAVSVMPFHLGSVVALLILGLGGVAQINISNFMDGADGYAALSALFVFFAGALAALALGADDLAWQCAFFGAATFGFFIWNLPPARLFMGDVGSIFLGALVVYVGLRLVQQGAGAVLVATQAWFWCDAAFTLAKRFRRGDRLAQAHRDHLYQQALTPHAGDHKRLLNCFLLWQGSNVVVTLALFINGLQAGILLFLPTLFFGVLYFQGLRRLAAHTEGRPRLV